MEVTISFSTISQIISLVFIAGGIYAWVKYKIQELTKDYAELEKKLTELEQQCNSVKSSVNDVRHESMPRDEAFKSFVAKEMMELHIKNIDKNMDEIKSMISKLEGKRSTD